MKVMKIIFIKKFRKLLDLAERVCYNIYVRVGEKFLKPSEKKVH